MLEELAPGDFVPADKGFKIARARINVERTMYCVTRHYIS